MAVVMTDAEKAEFFKQEAKKWSKVLHGDFTVSRENPHAGLRNAAEELASWYTAQAERDKLTKQIGERLRKKGLVAIQLFRERRGQGSAALYREKADMSSILKSVPNVEGKPVLGYTRERLSQLWIKLSPATICSTKCLWVTEDGKLHTFRPTGD